MSAVFVYEYCTAQGPGPGHPDPAHSLDGEGRAMRDAVAADFARLPGRTVLTLDGPVPDERAEFRRRLAACDAVLVIAPELDGILAERVAWATDTLARKAYLGCPTSLIPDLSSKTRTAAIWDAAGVPTPLTKPFRPETPVLPLVLKRDDGAGSTATRRVDTLDEWQSLVHAGHLDGIPLITLVTQPYHPGRPVSVAFLVGPNATMPLLPCDQHLSDDGRFTYLGGATPLPAPLAGRAVTLATRAVAAVPGLRGYIGVDLILGDAGDGSADVAIEINPRLTTSYVGLRALTEDNLMGKLWEVMDGAEGVSIRWKSGGIRFRADGTIERSAET